MSDEFAKAAREAVEAADNTDQLKLIAAFLAAQQLQQQTHPQPASAPHADFNARKWLTIGAVVCAVGAIGAVFAIAFALAAIAVAIGAVCATGCLLILRSIWRDIRNR